MPRAFAEDTVVPISKTRAEIDDLLRAWKADGIRWTEDRAGGRFVLEFLWAHEKAQYLARFIVAMPDEKTLRARSLHAKTRLVVESKLRRARELAGRHEHRVLLLWLKACFNAVHAKLTTPEAVFLPFLVGADGRTVAESVLPQMGKLLTGTGAQLFLPPPPEVEVER